MNQKLRNYPFWCLTIFFCIGVFLSSYFSLLLPISILFLTSILCLFLIRKKASNNTFIITSGLIFMLLGGIRYQLSNTKIQSNHITNLIAKNAHQKTTFSIKEIFKKSENSYNYKIRIHTIDNKKAKGYALLSIKKNNSTQKHKLGDSFVIYSKLYELKNTENPYTFEYSEYLKNQHITHKIWCKENQLYKIESLDNTWNKVSNKIRNHLKINLQKQHLTTEVLQITEALVLGNKSSLDTQLKTDFADAGVIHILAISGLHIGIIFLILNGFFNIFLPASKNNISISIIIVISLWLFAWFSGASPSALRATTMFTCFQISSSILRQQHPINALFLSVFILILYDPNLLFSVGFQLSVSAVGSIIIGVPKLLSIWFPKNWVVNKLWGIICVSICAQLGILPLSIYYFHQFSSLFLLANIPIMVGITVVLCAAITVVICSSFWIFSTTIINIYNKFILLIIDYISWIANFESFVLKKLYLSQISVVFIYVIIGYLFYRYKYPYRARKIHLSVFILVFTILVCFYEFNQRMFKDELWVLNKYNNTIVTEITSNQLQVYSSQKLSNQDLTFLIEPLAGSLHFSNFSTNKLLHSYRYKNEKIYIISSKNQIPKNTKNSIIILENSPKINLDRLILSGKPKLIIASNNNYNNFVQKWKTTCSNEQVVFYNISKNGAFNLSETLTNP